MLPWLRDSNCHTIASRSEARGFEERKHAMTEISQTGDQMLAVLEIVAAKGPLTVSEAARESGLNRTVVHRLLATLAKRSYLRRTRDGFVVGPMVLRLSHLADTDLRGIAMPMMQKLAQATGETVVLHGLDRDEAVVIDQALGEQNLVRVEHKPGSRYPLFRGASGWAILAWQDQKMIERASRGADARAVAARIKLVRAEGHAISHDELQQGVHGIAVPILMGNGVCEASISVLVPSTRASKLPALLEPLKKVASEVASHFA
jgi:DNA-binding IclR family transcriptional regulator